MPKSASPHLRGWLGIIGGFAPMTANAKARTSFVQQLTAFVRKHNLQGADIDWEHPKTAAEIANYQTLLIELKRAFVPHRLWLTVAAAGWGKHLKRETFPFIDRIHVMAYDQGTPHAPFAGAVKDLRYWETQGALRPSCCWASRFTGVTRKTQRAPTASWWRNSNRRPIPICRWISFQRPRHYSP